MRTLETRIPPPLIALLVAVAMWFIASAMPRMALPAVAREIATGVLTSVGIYLAVAGAARFRRARTTVNPLHPEQASALVTGGVFRFTRNPMYLGLLLILVAYAIFLASVPALTGPIAFVAYINRYQIASEERALEANFGGEYLDYKRRVRRWL